MDYILVKNPHKSYAKPKQLFSNSQEKKISNKNYINSHLEGDIEIGENVFIGQNVKIERVKINPGYFIGMMFLLEKILICIRMFAFTTL